MLTVLGEGGESGNHNGRHLGVWCKSV